MVYTYIKSVLNKYSTFSKTVYRKYAMPVYREVSNNEYGMVKEAHQATLRAWMSYFPPDVVQNSKFLSQNHGTTTEPIFFEDVDTGAEAYLWYYTENDQNKKIAYITFRGTNNIQDALSDVKVALHEFSGKAKIHRGFYDQFMAIEPQITTELKKEVANIEEIQLSGHSLGAGLATVAAVYYAYFHKFMTSCITVGSPRVGNQEFINMFLHNVQRHLRIVCSQDPVPNFPLCPEYVHTPLCLQIDDDCKIYVSNMNDYPLYQRVFVTIMSFNPFHPVEDHFVNEYARRLSKLWNTISKVQVLDRHIGIKK